MPLRSIGALGLSLVLVMGPVFPASAQKPSTNAATNTPTATATVAKAVSAAPAHPTPTPIAPPPIAPPPDFAADQASLTRIAGRVAITSNDAQLAGMGGQVAAIEAAARAAQAAAARQLADLDAALAKLTPKSRRAPSAAQQAKAAPLLAQRAATVAELGQAQALVAQAEQTFSAVAERRREGFSTRVLTRADSPLSPQFWTSLAAAAEGDLDRFEDVASDAVRAALRAPEPRAGLILAAALALAALMALPVRRWLERFGRRKTGEAVHPGFARTGAALWVAAVDAGAPTLAAAILHTGAEWAGLLSNQADALAGAAVGAVAWAAGIMALGRVIATETDASQRLAPVPDDVSRRLRLPLVVVALVTGAGFLLTRLNYVVGASVAATIATNCVVSLAYAAVAALILVSFGAAPAPEGETETEKAAEPSRSPTWTLISLALTAAIAITLVAVFAGYTTLAALTSGQIFWLSIIASAAWLLMRFADDFCVANFSHKGWAARTLYVLFGLRRSTIAQAGALVSAGLQIVVLAGAFSLALTPFGRSGDLLTANLADLGAPIRFGSVTVSPAAIAAGVATFIVGLAFARLAQRWIVRRYLPVTDWDSGVRNSVSTGVGYLGVAIALLCALGATGLGFTQIALVASALSVGIGFGLQNVVQNFVSGVILLVERPVKVGDWVNVGGVEGDIRRIRVRATEIRVADRSTVIVPNSDLITKSVQNKTLGEPVTRFELRLSVTDPAQVAKARDLILKIAEANDEIAKDPAPKVFIDSLAVGGGVNFTCALFVRDPRAGYRLRSACYFDIVEAFQTAKIAFAGITPAG